MKFSVLALLSLPALASAFSPSANLGRPAFATKLFMAGAAKTAEEDLEMTRKVIMDFISVDDGSEEEASTEEASEE